MTWFLHSFSLVFENFPDFWNFSSEKHFTIYPFCAKALSVEVFGMLFYLVRCCRSSASVLRWRRFYKSNFRVTRGSCTNWNKYSSKRSKKRFVWHNKTSGNAEVAELRTVLQVFSQDCCLRVCLECGKTRVMTYRNEINPENPHYYRKDFFVPQIRSWLNEK